MTIIKEVSRKVLRKRLTQQILNAGNYEEALVFKEEMKQNEFSLSPKIYHELFIKCSDLTSALLLKKEMEISRFSISEEIYIMLIKKEKDFSSRIALLEEMESKDISPTIKTYYTLIKIEEDIQKNLFIFNRMKAKRIEPDGRLYKLLHTKLLGSREYITLKKEIDTYESTKLFILKFLSFENFEDSLRFLYDEGRLIDSKTIEKLIYRIEDFDDRFKLLTKSMEEGLELNHILYWTFLQKTANNGLAASNKELLKTLGYSLSTSETQKWHNLFTSYFKKIGGKGKHQLQIAFEEAEIKKEAMLASDLTSFFYLQGKAAGIAFPKSEIEEELKHIEDLDPLMDEELFKYEVIKSKGILEGRKRNEEIYATLLSKKIPILNIIFLIDNNILSELYNHSITLGLYPYEFEEINQFYLSGCFFTNSIFQLQKTIEKIDFDSFDVVVNLFFDEGNVQFYKEYPGSENWLQIDYPKTKALMPNFRSLKEREIKNINSLFSSLYLPVSFSKNDL